MPVENMRNDHEFQKLMQKMEKAKKDSSLDLSRDEDLSIAIMNLVSIEEHFFFTAVKTDKTDQYLKLLNQVREMRKELLEKLLKNKEGENWCIAKHLLAASMRLMEVGTKALGKGNKKDADDFFKKSFELYSMFWALNLKLIDTKGIKKIKSDKINVHDHGSGFLGKIGSVIKRAIDCCKE